MELSKRNKDLKPAISSEDVIKAITSTIVEIHSQKAFSQEEGFDEYSLENEEEELLKRFEKGEVIQYEADVRKKNQEKNK